MLKKRSHTSTQVLVAAAFLIAMVMGIFALPFTQWGFKTDDWANILHSKLSSLDDIFNLFREGNMESINHPSGSGPDTGSFLSGLYRPLSFLYYYPQTLLFGTHAYGYFFVTILFHALNAGLFFLALTYFFPFSYALAGAAFFAFHPSLQNWLGWISAQTYFIELFILELIFFSFYRWFTSKKPGWYWLSVVLFFLNLLLKEASILFPVWVGLTVLLFTKDPLRERIKKSFFAASGFVITAAAYCLIRLSCMPFITTGTSTLGFSLSWNSFITKQIARAMQLLTLTYDILSLTWLPKGNRLLNGSILLVLLMLLVLLFLRSPRKKIVIFCLVSTALFSWPGLIMHYQPRYMYMALPWFIVALLTLVQDYISHANNAFIKKIAAIGLAIYIPFTAFFVYKNLKEREHTLHFVDSSLRTLVYNTLPAAGWHKDPLCFVWLPAHLFDMGTAQAVWFLDGVKPHSYPVYQPTNLLFMPSHNHARAIPQSTQATVSCTVHNNVVTITTSNQNIFSINGMPGQSILTLSLPKPSDAQKMFYVTWDYEKAQFKVIE